MKRLLSVIIAMALVISLVPAVFASTEVEAAPGWEAYPESYYYLFKPAAFGSTTALDPSASAHTIAAIETYNATEGNTKASDPWGYVLQNNGASFKIESTGFRYNSYLNKTGDVNAQGADGGKAATYDPSVAAPIRYLLLEIKVSSSGTYSPVLEYYGDSNNSAIDLYIKKQADGETKLTTTTAAAAIRSWGEEARLGYVDMYLSPAENTEAVFPSVTLDAGTYYLAFVINGSNPNGVYATGSNGYYFGNHYGAFRLDAVKNTAEAVEYTYDLSTKNLKIAPIGNANIGVEVDGYLTYWGADSSSNDNRYAFGWVGSYQNQPWIRNLETVSTHTYLQQDKTAPWRVVYSKDSTGTDSKYCNRPYTTCFSQFGFYMNVEVADIKAGDVTPTSSTPYVAIEVTVPTSGSYNLSLSSTYYECGANSNIYFVPAAADGKVTASDFASSKIVGTHCFYRSEYDEDYPSVNSPYTGDLSYNAIGSVEVSEPGKYYVIMSPHTTGASTTLWDNKYYCTSLSGIKLTRTGNYKTEADKEYDESVSVDTETAAPVTRAEESASITTVAADVEGNPVAGAIIDKSGDASVGGSYTVKANDVEGYKFLYWARGMGVNKRFVSRNAEYTFKPTAGNNWLTAVYRADDSEKTVVVFYNGNREEKSKSLYNVGDTITIPALPSMAGFDTASKWILAETNTEYDPGDTVAATGDNMSFVAKYGDEIEVTVTTNATADKTNPKYGEDVTVTANLRDASGANIFAYWEKDGEVVSFDRSYTFKAWKNTTVNAVYKEYPVTASTIRKIILNTFTVGGEAAVMAEYILPGVTVVEKGIVFGDSLDENVTARAAMSGNGNYFSMIDDISADPIGYAILSDGSVIYSK